MSCVVNVAIKNIRAASNELLAQYKRELQALHDQLETLQLAADDKESQLGGSPKGVSVENNNNNNISHKENRDFNTKERDMSQVSPVRSPNSSIARGPFVGNVGGGEGVEAARRQKVKQKWRLQVANNMISKLQDFNTLLQEQMSRTNMAQTVHSQLSSRERSQRARDQEEIQVLRCQLAAQLAKQRDLNEELRSLEDAQSEMRAARERSLPPQEESSARASMSPSPDPTRSGNEGGGGGWRIRRAQSSDEKTKGSLQATSSGKAGRRILIRGNSSPASVTSSATSANSHMYSLGERRHVQLQLWRAFTAALLEAEMRRENRVLKAKLVRADWEETRRNQAAAEVTAAAEAAERERTEERERERGRRAAEEEHKAEMSEKFDRLRTSLAVDYTQASLQLSSEERRRLLEVIEELEEAHRRNLSSASLLNWQRWRRAEKCLLLKERQHQQLVQKVEARLQAVVSTSEGPSDRMPTIQEGLGGIRDLFLSDLEEIGGEETVDDMQIDTPESRAKLSKYHRTLGDFPLSTDLVPEKIQILPEESDTAPDCRGSISLQSTSCQTTQYLPVEICESPTKIPFRDFRSSRSGRLLDMFRGCFATRSNSFSTPVNQKFRPGGSVMSPTSTGLLTNLAFDDLQQRREQFVNEVDSPCT